MGAGRIICVLATLLTLSCPLPSSAGMTLTVTSPGDGTFCLAGANVDGVEAVELTVDYDTTYLANPQVGLQGGTFTSISADSPGKISAGIFRENPDVVFEMDLVFEKKGEYPGIINYVTATMKDTEGRSYPVPVTIVSPPPRPVKSAGHETGGEKAVKASSPKDTTNVTRRDVGVLRGRPGARTDSGTDTASAATRQAKPDQAAGQGPGEEELSPWFARKSVLQRFREFDGEKGLKECVSLFDSGNGDGIVQEPAIALSDGKSPVRISLRLDREGNYPPNFALSDARFVSLREESENHWVMTVVPGEGAWEVSLILKTGRRMIVFPLVVAPPVKIPGGINEKNFRLALRSYLSARAAGSDGENAPLPQYLHEYIFTANYLANLSSLPAKQASR